MSTTAAELDLRNFSSVKEQDIAVIDRILQRIDRRNSLLETLVHWKLAFTLFKEFELAHTVRDKHERKRWEADHRAVLTRLLAVSESLNLEVDKLSDADLAEV